MKKITFIASFFFLSVFCVSWSELITNISKDYQNQFYNKFDVVSDAIEGIQKTLIEENGKPYFVRRIYNFGDDKIEVITKSHYAEYRKKPSYKKEFINFSNINQTGSEIEFIYKKSNKNQITQINKKTKHPSIKEQHIDFHFSDVTEDQSNPINFLANLVSI